MRSMKGFEAGIDEILKGVSQRILKKVRGVYTGKCPDGEEFLFVGPERDMDIVMMVAE